MIRTRIATSIAFGPFLSLAAALSAEAPVFVPHTASSNSLSSMGGGGGGGRGDGGDGTAAASS